MTDDVTKAIARMRDRMANGDPDWWRDEELILRHIDGESARLAAAKEETREACAQAGVSAVRHSQQTTDQCRQEVGDAIRATPLTATPLADEIAALRARVAELEAEQEVRDDVMTAEQRLKFWADNPHACPNHFGARTACAQCFDSLSQQFTNLQIEHEAVLRDSRTAEAERDALRAQVEAARTYARQSLDYGEDCDAHDLLKAMDEAKP